MAILDFDKLLLDIGGFGPYQKKNCAILGLAAGLFCGYCHFAMVFMLFQPDFFCKTPAPISLNISTDDCAHCQAANMKNLTFDTQVTGWTLVSEYRLICNRHWLYAMVLNAFSVGDLIGAVLIPLLTDVFGRKPLFFCIISLFLASSLMMVLIRNVYIVAIARLLQGCTGGPTFHIPSVWAMEIIDKSRRTFTINLFVVSFALSVTSLAPMAYLLKSWIKLGLASSLPLSVFFLTFWVLDESPRWLLATGEERKAQKIIMKMAKANGKSLPKGYFTEKHLMAQQESQESTEPISLSLIDRVLLFFHNSDLFKKVMVLATLLSCNSLVYHTFHYNIENLPADPYITFALTAVVEAPAAMLNVVVVQKFGRVRTISTVMAMGGVAAIFSCLVDHDLQAVIVGLSVVLKFAISMSFTTVIQMESELFPTQVRVIGVGICSIISISCNLLMPFVLASAKISASIPMLIFGIITVFGAVLGLFLPETKGKPLPASASDSKMIGGVSFGNVATNLLQCGQAERPF